MPLLFLLHSWPPGPSPHTLLPAPHPTFIEVVEAQLPPPPHQQLVGRQRGGRALQHQTARGPTGTAACGAERACMSVRHTCVAHVCVGKQVGDGWRGISPHSPTPTPTSVWQAQVAAWAQVRCVNTDPGSPQLPCVQNHPHPPLCACTHPPTWRSGTDVGGCERAQGRQGGASIGGAGTGVLRTPNRHAGTHTHTHEKPHWTRRRDGSQTRGSKASSPASLGPEPMPGPMNVVHPHAPALHHRITSAPKLTLP